jgi:hypothetical protein
MSGSPANEYLVERHNKERHNKERHNKERHNKRGTTARPCEDTTEDTTGACCWVEVYDSEPGWGNRGTAVRLNAGYISEAQDTLEQLCALLPLEQWARPAYCMRLGCVGGEVYFLGSDLSRGALNERLDTTLAHELIYHNEQRGFEKMQLVIVRRADSP